MIKNGETNISVIKYGELAITKVYNGETLVWSRSGGYLTVSPDYIEHNYEQQRSSFTVSSSDPWTMASPFPGINYFPDIQFDTRHRGLYFYVHAHSGDTIRFSANHDGADTVGIDVWGNMNCNPYFSYSGYIEFTGESEGWFCVYNDHEFYDFDLGNIMDYASAAAIYWSPRPFDQGFNFIDTEQPEQFSGLTYLFDFATYYGGGSVQHPGLDAAVNAFKNAGKETIRWMPSLLSGASGRTEVAIVSALDEVSTGNTTSNMTITSSGRTKTLTYVKKKKSANEIEYTTVSGEAHYAFENYGWGATCIGNEYVNGKGVATYDGPITTVPANVFQGDTDIKTIKLPDSIVTIGNNAFRYASSLEETNLPTNLTNLGQYAFQDCPLKRFPVIPSGITQINTGVFASNYATYTALTVPDTVITIKGGAFRYNSYLKVANIGGSITSINNNAFRDLTALAEINISAMNAPTLGTDVFTNCNSTGALNVPYGATGYDSWIGTHLPSGWTIYYDL